MELNQFITNWIFIGFLYTLICFIILKNETYKLNETLNSLFKETNKVGIIYTIIVLILIVILIFLFIVIAPLQLFFLIINIIFNAKLRKNIFRN